MEQFVNAGYGLLSDLWEALHRRAIPPRLYAVDRLFNKFATSGWAFVSDLEDVLDALDSRLNYRCRDVLKLLDVKLEEICFTPRSRQTNTSFFEGIRVEEAAYVLIILERLGFMTFPDRLVDLILPNLKSQKPTMLTGCELNVMRYHSLRHKDQPLRLIFGERAEIMHGRGEKCTSISGFKVEAMLDSESRVTMLTSTAPRFRKMPHPVTVKCPECGFLYEKGDPDANCQHRQAHKKVMLYLRPEPSKRFNTERLNSSEPELVRSDSPKWKHKEMFIRARAFNREMGYDSIMWGAEGEDDPYVHGYLFSDISDRIVGACSFRNRTETGCAEIWALQWVWICPMERRNGHLSRRWQLFRERFKDFYVEPPVSKEMEAFLIKQGDTNLTVWPYNCDKHP
ncbi:hypothetical protein IWX76_002869 [Pedobacter sp. CAN_A7]|uniref:hypothetical protein n=1 Tax=Pedobacter sp. CAN_A7 TaxID=2787722 RepID=UPI0018CB6084